MQLVHKTGTCIHLFTDLKRNRCTYSYLRKQVHVYSYLLIQCSWFTKGTRIHLFANSMLLEYEAGTHIQLFSDTMVLVHETGTHIQLFTDTMVLVQQSR